MRSLTRLGECLHFAHDRSKSFLIRCGGDCNCVIVQLRLFWRLAIRSSTTAGSASVEVSPRLEKSSSAILRRMRRMILPSASSADRA